MLITSGSAAMALIAPVVLPGALGFSPRSWTSSSVGSALPAGCRRRSSVSDLGGLRKARGPEGSDKAEGSGSRGEKFHERYTTPASKRKPPEEDDIWSKHSVFEFKSLNDPATNASSYTGLSGQPRGPSSSDQRRNPSQAVPPERRLASSGQAGAIFDAGIEELLEAERPVSPFGGGGSEAAAAAAIDDDFFSFREKEALVGTNRRREVVEHRRRRGPAGSGRGGGGGGGGGGGSSERSAVKVELATQLGVPATSTYEELRTAYRVEIKRCHPDLAGDNDFRVRFLERKFLKLQGCWDEFNAEQTAGGKGGGGGTAAAAAAEAGAGSGQAARARARARAQEEARGRQQAAAAAAAAARRSRRPVMDEGRKVLDTGDSSSC